MIQLLFKNLEPSDLVKDVVKTRIVTFVEKFPDLNGCKITVTLEMENSPSQAGPDSFSVKFFVATGRYRGVCVTKSAKSLYVASSDVLEHLLEKLNRFGDRTRVKERTHARKQAKILLYPKEAESVAEESLS